QTLRRRRGASRKAFRLLPADEDRTANRPEASVFHDGFKTCALEAFPGRFGGLWISVRADLHVVILVCLGRNNERREFFLLQARRQFKRIRFFGERRDLQSVSATWNERGGRRFRWTAVGSRWGGGL